jgi:hypothetical protein
MKLQDIREAHRISEKAGLSGKIVLVPWAMRVDTDAITCLRAYGLTRAYTPTNVRELFLLNPREKH